MTTAYFLIEWAIRSAILMAAGGLLLRLLRVKDPSIRLAAWTAVVCGSLAMPLLTAAFPKLPVPVMQATAVAPTVSLPAPPAAPSANTTRHRSQIPASSRRISWETAVVTLYVMISGLLLLRLGTGLWLARSLRRHSRGTELTAEGANVLESERVTAPVTVGIVRPAILLPADWREWGKARLDAVLAHEQSHIRRRDPAVQFLSALHRALLWHSPLSWMLHRNIVRLAEDASDDAAVAVTGDRTSYAETLLEFMQRGVRVNWHGVAMARYGCADDRIHRILNGTMLSTGVKRGAVAMILTVAVPLAYVAAAAAPSRPAPAALVSLAASPSPVVETVLVAAAQTPAAPPSAAATGRPDTTIRRYMIFLGNTESGSWDSRDTVSPETMRARFGNRFAWLRQQSGTEHVITDEGVLSEFEKAMEPQRKVNEEQDQVNRMQSKVNELQSKQNFQQDEVNAAQNKVNVAQDKVNAAQNSMNKRQDLLNRIQNAAERDSKDAAIRKVEDLLNQLRASAGVSTQEDVNRLQSEVNEHQDRVNELQNKVNRSQDGVNAEQNKVNQVQGQVNELQTRVSAEFHKRIQEIFESALSRGLARPVDKLP